MMDIAPDQNLTISNYKYSDPYQNNLVYSLSTNKALFLTKLCIKVYKFSISLEYRPVFGNWENRQTYNVADIGKIYIKKSRKRATIGVCRASTAEVLFEIKNLSHDEAEDLKDALDFVLSTRYYQVSSSRNYI